MKRTKLINFYLILLIFASAVSITLRSLSLIYDFRVETMHFADDILFTLSAALAAISTVGFFVYLFVGPKDEDLIPKNNDPASYLPAGIISMAMLFMGVNTLGSLSFIPEGVLRYLAIAYAVLSLLSVAGFFLNVFIERRQDLTKAVFHLAIVMMLVVYAIYLYFNKQVHPTNSENKIIDQMAYLFSAAFFLYEARICLGRQKWRGYFAFGLTATLLSLYSAIPTLIYYLTDGYLLSQSLSESLLTLSLAIFIGSRVFRYKNLTPNAKCRIAEELEALDEVRRREIEDQRNAEKAKLAENDGEEVISDAQNYTFDIPYVEASADFNPDGEIKENDGES